MKKRIVLLILVLFLFLSLIWSGGTNLLKSIESLVDVPLQLLNMEQYLNGRRIKTEWSESLLSYGGVKSTYTLYVGDKVEIKNFRIANNSIGDISLRIKSGFDMFSVTDMNGGMFQDGDYIMVSAGDVSCSTNIYFEVQEFRKNGEKLVFQIEDEKQNVLMEFFIDYIEYYDCADCFLCEEKKWTGISGVGEFERLPPHDVNISDTDDFDSENSPSLRNIAIGGDRLHVVWIEHMKRRNTRDYQKNVFYSYTDLPVSRHNRWSEPVNVSGFTDPEIQIKSVSVVADEKSVFIVWNTEVNHDEGDPWITEKDDNHYLFCVKGDVDKVGCWYAVGDELVPYSPPINKKDVTSNAAYFSQNGDFDSWNPEVEIDYFGRPHIVWQNGTQFQPGRRYYVYDCIYWVFWEDGWKVMDKGLEYPYEFTSKGDCKAIIIAEGYGDYKNPSIKISVMWNNVYDCYGSSERITISFEATFEGAIMTFETCHNLDNKYWGISLIYEGEYGKKVDVAHDVFSHSSHDFIRIYEINGNIIATIRPPVIDDSGKCSNPKIEVSTYESCEIIQGVYEREDDIWYFRYCWNSGEDLVMNLSRTETVSRAPSIDVDDRGIPHVVWTEDLPDGEAEIIYKTLSFSDCPDCDH